MWKGGVVGLYLEYEGNLGNEIEPQEKGATRGDIWKKTHNKPIKISGILERSGNHLKEVENHENSGDSPIKTSEIIIGSISQ